MTSQTQRSLLFAFIGSVVCFALAGIYCMLVGHMGDLEVRIRKLLADAVGARGHIFNLGHGILPQTPPEQAKIAVDAVHRFSRRD